MANNGQTLNHQCPANCVLLPIHQMDEATPVVVCVLGRANSSSEDNPFFLLRDLPGAQIFLGALCDADAKILDWVEIWVQMLQYKELAFSGYQEQLSNLFFDQRWQAESKSFRTQMPNTVIGTKMEVGNPGPVLVKLAPPNGGGFAFTKTTHWRVCTNDAVLQDHGLTPYNSSPFRYLHEPGVTTAKTFLAITADTPVNSHVQGLERLKAGTDCDAVFNPGGGLIRVIRHCPMDLDCHLQILEGRPWSENLPENSTTFAGGSQYSALQAWSSNPQGLPFLLNGKGNLGDRLNEIFLLKLSLLHDMLKKVRAHIKAHQLPLLNLTPASFNVSLEETGDLFPLLWSAECNLIKPGQAYPLKIKSTEQKYFIRLGRIEPSPFLPEGMGAHSFGIGSIQIRNVTSTEDGLSFEGTLVAEDYLAIDPHDLLWFKVPVGENRLEFYAHVYKADNVGPREVRFRTVPAKLSETVTAALKQSAGIRFPKSPYEIWPLLSSPCDLFSIGVIGVRILLANSQSNLPVALDEIQSLARRVNDKCPSKEECLKELQASLQKDARLYELLSPKVLMETGGTPAQAWAMIHTEIWQEAICLLLRLFPDTGANGFCQSFGDVSPVALETVFDRPLQEFELLVFRLRSLLFPSFSDNREIAAVILEQIGGAA